MKSIKLIVTATDYNKQYSADSYEFPVELEVSHSFPVYELENGLIIVVSNDTNDWYYESREEIDANGNDFISDVTETDSIREWDLEDLRESIEASLKEFGSVPKKALAMLS